jgi:hypothetical protein
MSFHDWKYLRFAPELAPAHPPLAYPIYASGMENISAYAAGFPPAAPNISKPATCRRKIRGIHSIYNEKLQQSPEK